MHLEVRAHWPTAWASSHSCGTEFFLGVSLASPGCCGLQGSKQMDALFTFLPLLHYVFQINNSKVLCLPFNLWNWTTKSCHEINLRQCSRNTNNINSTASICWIWEFVTKLKTFCSHSKNNHFPKYTHMVEEERKGHCLISQWDGNPNLTLKQGFANYPPRSVFPGWHTAKNGYYVVKG